MRRAERRERRASRLAVADANTVDYLIMHRALMTGVASDSLLMAQMCM